MHPEALDGILGETDPVARNRAITAEYVRLAHDLGAVVGTTDANWLHFGAWASASAGIAIRGEHLPVDLGVDAGRTAVLRGNTAIISDVAPRFEAFLDCAQRHEPARLAAAVRAHPLLGASDALADAFACYAALASDPPPTGPARAQLMLRANLGIAHHEQQFADAVIRDAVPGGSVVGRLASLAIVLRLPDGDLRVSRDVPPPGYLAGRPWPADLAVLTDDRLLALAAAYGQDLTTPVHSDAPDWQDFDERMGYIFCLFRAYQQDPAIRRPPLE